MVLILFVLFSSIILFGLPLPSRPSLSALSIEPLFVFSLEPYLPKVSSPFRLTPSNPNFTRRRPYVCVRPCGSACPMKCFFFSISSGWQISLRIFSAPLLSHFPSSPLPRLSALSLELLLLSTFPNRPCHKLSLAVADSIYRILSAFDLTDGVIVEKLTLSQQRWVSHVWLKRH